MLFLAPINLHASLLLIMFIFALTPTLLLATTPSQDFPIAKPNCDNHCGDIRIPFPFGTAEECYQNSNFMVTCNETLSPPKLFWGTIEVRDISLDGQIKFLQFIARDCYTRNGTRITNTPWINLAPHFTVNNTANKFTIVGCDAYALVSGQRLDRGYMTGCTAMCDSKEDLIEGSCTGVGCCQTPIPGNVSTVDVEVKSYSNYSDVWDFNNCGYAFVVEESEFRFFPENLTNLYHVESLPIVVDWAIGNGTCEEAKMNLTTYACVSPNSTCYKPENGYGYRCRCEGGYQGNPYLVDGCQDIDECANATLSDCSEIAVCNNTAGNYACSCPDGYSGDGRGPDGCSKKQDTKIASNKKDMKIAYILIGVAFGITALLLAVILSHLELKRRSSKRMKQKFFLQNGGILLQEKLTRRERSPDIVKIFC